MLDSIKANWETTVMGLGVILVALGPFLIAVADGDESTVPDWQALMTAVTAGIGLIFARTAWKSSQDSGIRNEPGAGKPPIN
jgi:hypothetical protein